MNASSNIKVIALATFREATRGKQLLAVLLLAAALVSTMTVFGMVTIGDHGRVIKDFGLFAVSFASIAYVSIAGASFLDKELTRKTIYNVLGKAVARWHFIVGKYLGMLLTAALLAAVLMVVVIALAWLVEGKFDPSLLVAYGFVFLEVAIVCAAALFFSTIVVTPVLSGLFTFGVFLAGRSADYLLYFIEKRIVTGAGEWILKGLYWGLPNFAQLNVSNFITFGVQIPVSQMVWAAIYATSYSCLLLWCSCILFSKKDFN